MKCAECNGKGWNVGDCHPRERCGFCLGLGTDEIPVMKREHHRYLTALREIASVFCESTAGVLAEQALMSDEQRQAFDAARAARSGSAGER